jgi:hypothetical protein
MNGGMGGGRGCGFSSLMKQKIKGKNCAVFCFAGKRFFFIYEVITWEKRKKSSTIHYWGPASKIDTLVRHTIDSIYRLT